VINVTCAALSLRSVTRPTRPARVTIGVASLPRGAQVEIDAVMHLG